ncbi:MAG: hypothetical protein H6696_12925 [Deferribacteres bacterium]|nr:hypothetical protein [candidate division KSB1 bacterium]MCB9502832.1 hypothetical protein [Deferribacteres bacterium]
MFEKKAIAGKPILKKIFLALVLFTLIVILGMQMTGSPLKTEAAPAGIVSFEFAGDLVQAQKIFASWGEMERTYAALNTGLDFLFLVSYTFTLALGSLLAARFFTSRSRTWSRVGYLLIWGMFAAGLLDAVENIALIQMLLGTTNNLWPSMAYKCASVKFFLVGIGLFYVLSWFGARIVLIFKKDINSVYKNES